MDILEGDIHESPGINAHGSLVTGELSGEDENIDVTGEVKITFAYAGNFVFYRDSKT